jgi:hypothetical protein
MNQSIPKAGYLFDTQGVILKQLTKLYPLPDRLNYDEDWDIKINLVYKQDEIYQVSHEIKSASCSVLNF